MSLAQHIMLRLVDSRVIAHSEELRRGMSRSILSAGRDYRLLVFRGVDTHLHMGAACTRPHAGQLARRVEISLRRRLGLPVAFEVARIKPVHDQWHLTRLFDYVMRQEQRHGAAVDAWFTASNLPDLLGMRLVGGYTADNVRAYLPRLGRRQLLGYLGYLGCSDLDGAPLAIDELADAAAAAFALPHLRGNRRDAVRARRAAAQATARWASAADVAELLAIAPRAVHRLRAQPLEERAVRAVRLQLQLRGTSMCAATAGRSRPTLAPSAPVRNW